MSLYDDYKKQQGKAKPEEKAKPEVTTKPNQPAEVKSSVTKKDDEVNVGSEVYKIVNIPFYKKKEFYMLIGGLVVISVVLFLLLYTPSFEMEDLTGRDKDYATTYGETYDLNVSPKEEFSDDVAKGEIFEQSLKPGEKYKEGSVLEVVISLGPNYDILVEYPDFSLLTSTEATTWKTDNKAMGTEIVTEYSNDVPEGEFIKEELDSGVDKSKFKRSSKVKIYYSKGKKPESELVTISDFTNKTVSEVAIWALQNDIVLTVKEEFALYLPPNTVIAQSIESGTKVEKKSTLSITVAVGEGVTVPSFASTTPDTAANLGVPIGTVSQRYSSSVPKGTLISQSYAQYSVIKDTDSIDLVYSLGLVPIEDYVGMSEPAVYEAINMLNQNGANLKVTYVDTPISGAPEGTVEGTVAAQSVRNDLVNPGTSITITVYR